MSEQEEPGAAAMERLRVYRERRDNVHHDIREAYFAGHTQAEISRASGMSRQWIAQFLPRKSQEETRAERCAAREKPAAESTGED